MAKRDDVLNVMGRFDASLGRWHDRYGMIVPQTRAAQAASLHIRHTQAWIKPILEHPEALDALMTSRAADYFNKATFVIDYWNPAAANPFATMCSEIDAALGYAYSAIAPPGRPATFAIGEPPSYERTLSFLPGDSDFPTDSPSKESDANSPAGFVPWTIKKTPSDPGAVG